MSLQDYDDDDDDDDDSVVITKYDQELGLVNCNGILANIIN